MSKQILVVESFCKVEEYGINYYFNINDTTQERVKEFLVNHCKQHRSFYKYDVTDDCIEQAVAEIEFTKGLSFWRHMPGIFLFVSGQVEGLL